MYKIYKSSHNHHHTSITGRRTNTQRRAVTGVLAIGSRAPGICHCRFMTTLEQCISNSTVAEITNCIMRHEIVIATAGVYPTAHTHSGCSQSSTHRALDNATNSPKHMTQQCCTDQAKHQAKTAHATSESDAQQERGLC
jgi:hypothetical protein